MKKGIWVSPSKRYSSPAVLLYIRNLRDPGLCRDVPGEEDPVLEHLISDISRRLGDEFGRIGLKLRGLGAFVFHSVGPQDFARYSKTVLLMFKGVTESVLQRPAPC